MKFSVLIPVYSGDSAEGFKKALASIFSNTIVPNQVVVVVDGPVDAGINRVLSGFSDEDCLVIIRLDKNGGLVRALNVGLNHCDHELVARCDADDVNFEHRFAEQINLFSENPDLIISGSQVLEYCSETSSLLMKSVPCTHNEISSLVRFRNPMNHMSVMFRKSAVINIGGYPNIKYREDYALWASLIAGGATASNHPDALVRASAGVEMYARRGRSSDLVYEIQLQRHLHRLGLLTSFEVLRNLVVRGGNMLVGTFIRGLVYRRFLRKRSV